MEQIQYNKNPYRIELNTLSLDASPEELVDATEELFEVRLADKITFDDASRWLHHPDERVALEFIKTLKDSKADLPAELHTAVFYEFIIKELQGRVEAEDEVWTPLLSAARENLYWELTHEETERTIMKGVSSPKEQLLKGVDWIKTAPASQLEPLLTNPPEREVLYLIARYARVLSFEQIEHLIHLESNGNINWDIHKALILNENTGPKVREWLAEQAIRHGRHRSATDEVFDRFNNPPYKPSDRLVSRLVTKPFEEAKRRDQISAFGGRPAFFENMLGLLSFNALTGSQILELSKVLEEMGHSFRHRWSSFASHPNAPASVIKKILEKDTGATAASEACLTITNRPDLQADPEVWRLFLAQAEWDSFILLADKLSSTEYEMFRKRLHAASAYKIKNWMVENKKSLSADARVVPALLTHPDRTVRMALFEQIPQLSSEEEAPKEKRKRGGR